MPAPIERRTRLAAAGLILLSAGLTRCALEGSSAQVTAPTDRPVPGGVLRIVQEAPASLDPAAAGSVYESLPVNQLFDGLIEIDPGLRTVPALASRWTLSRDGRIYTFRLRPGVKFHDGSALTADDVVFTFQRLLKRQGESIASSYIAVVSGSREFALGRRPDLPGVEAVDPLTVRISLDRPYLSFLQVLGLDGLRIVPRHVVERLGDAAFGRAPVGTGPFRLVAWKPEGLELAANPDYFKGRALLDGVQIGFLEPNEGDAGASRFERGEIDLLEVPGSDDIDQLSKNPRVRIHRYQELNLTYVGLCLRTPPLDDERVRQAIACAIDRDAIVAAMPQTRRNAIGILPPGLDGYSPQPKALPHDPARARQLLADAGHPGGRGLPPIDFYNANLIASSSRIGEQVRTDLAAVGIQVRLHDVPWTELIRRLQSRTAPMFRLGWVADITDPDSFLRSPFESGGSVNYFDYRDPYTESLLGAGAREMNPVRRAAIYREIEKRVLDQAPIVPLYHSVNFLATRDYVRNLEPGPMGVSNLDFEKVWLAPSKARS